MLESIAPWLPGFAAAFAIQAVAVASPGPGVALLLGLALSRGRSNALAAALGIAAGSAALALASTLGLGLLMERVAWLSTAVRVAGALYLLWLALKAWQRAAGSHRVEIASAADKSGLLHSFWSGVGLQATNPKAIVFWLAIAAVGATDGAPAPIVTLFIVGAFSLSLFGHGAYAIVLSSKPFRLTYERGRRWIEAGIGVCLAWFAFRLATERS